jgi:hypothetical protein
MAKLLWNCTEGLVGRKLLVADALFIIAQADIARKQLLRVSNYLAVVGNRVEQADTKETH